MELDVIRKQLNYYDNIIKNMITLRMSLIPIVADIKIKNKLPLFQPKRENEIYRNIEIFAEKSGVDCNLVKNIYQLIMTEALKKQEKTAEHLEPCKIDKNINVSELEPIREMFEKLDTIIEKQIPEIMLDIMKECELKGLNLTQMATGYYENKKNHLNK